MKGSASGMEYPASKKRFRVDSDSLCSVLRLEIANRHISVPCNCRLAKYLSSRRSMSIKSWPPVGRHRNCKNLTSSSRSSFWGQYLFFNNRISAGNYQPSWFDTKFSLILTGLNCSREEIKNELTFGRRSRNLRKLNVMPVFIFKRIYEKLAVLVHVFQNT